MIYFTSDLHFMHKNILKFGRPFSSIEEHDATLIKNWNSVVTDKDTIYILGDIALNNKALEIQEILQQLNGTKHLVIGNHDSFIRNIDFAPHYFESISYYTELRYNGHFFCLMHYPITSWNKMYHGSIMLHGHMHNYAEYNLENREKNKLIYDVGVDANNYSPISANSIIDFFTQERNGYPV